MSLGGCKSENLVVAPQVGIVWLSCMINNMMRKEQWATQKHVNEIESRSLMINNQISSTTQNLNACFSIFTSQNIGSLKCSTICKRNRSYSSDLLALS